MTFSQSTLAVGRRRYKPTPRITLFKNSRPCCSLTQDPFSKLMGYTKTTNVSMLEDHIYQNSDTNKEGNGLLYTCKAGYIDLTHLRDTADWTKEVFELLGKHLGKDKSITVKEEGAKRRLHFLSMDTRDLTRQDLLIIAANISYENSVWHEIATGFDFVKFQHMSAFSPEDNYSNYLGTHLAKEALTNDGDFNSSMTDNIYDFLLHNKNHPTKESVSNDLTALEGIVWKYSGFMTDLIIRNTKTYGSITSFKSPNHLKLGCSKKSLKEKGSLKVENILSNGKSASDYFDLEATISNSMKKKFAKAGKKIKKEYLTEEDNLWLIPLMIRYRKL
ncbi:hypothetical protein A9Q84_04945 [Halobacteriovorax marinus]|uniref:Uncharacterized protein n=1 Tax=Halobacteriovorax marinus TaxID=97084 RepID=A0A1Y5FGD0_9BACT|nr:hypothetical protein A9Q84_04945 [Halobacteriovorax marinus]